VRVTISDRFKPKLETLANDLELPLNKVIDLVLRQYLTSFEQHMKPGTLTSIQSMPEPEPEPELSSEALPPIEFGEL
jgi:hypothetical protein